MLLLICWHFVINMGYFFNIWSHWPSGRYRPNPDTIPQRILRKSNESRVGPKGHFAVYLILIKFRKYFEREFQPEWQQQRRQLISTASPFKRSQRRLKVSLVISPMGRTMTMAMKFQTSLQDVSLLRKTGETHSLTHSVTRSGNFLDLGQLFKAFGNN